MRGFVPGAKRRFTLNLLLAIGLLLGTIAPVWGPAANARGAPEAALPAGSGTPRSAELVVVDVEGPESVGPDETITLTVIVNNVGVAPVRGARVHMREEAGAGISGRAVQPLPDIAVGGQAQVEFSSRVNANPGEELRITFEVKGGIDQPASGLYRAVARQDEADVWTVQAGAGTWQVSELLALAWAGSPDPQVIRIYHRALYPESDRDRRSIYRFQLWAHDGNGAEVTHLAQPLRLRWQIGERLAGRPTIAPVLRLWDPVDERWQHVATRLYLTAGYIEAELTRGGVYDVQGGVVRQLLRTRERRFYPSDTIKDRLAEEWVWAGTEGSDCRSYRRLYYDGAGAHTLPDGRIVFAGTPQLPETKPNIFSGAPALLAQLNQPWNIYLTDLESLLHESVGEEQIVLSGVKGIRGPVVSPDGRALAFLGTYRGHKGLWVYGMDTKKLARVWTGFGPFAWSPDGSELIVLMREPNVEFFLGKPARIKLPDSLISKRPLTIPDEH